MKKIMSSLLNNIETTIARADLVELAVFLANGVLSTALANLWDYCDYYYYFSSNKYDNSGQVHQLARRSHSIEVAATIDESTSEAGNNSIEAQEMPSAIREKALPSLWPLILTSLILVVINLAFQIRNGRIIATALSKAAAVATTIASEQISISNSNNNNELLLQPQPQPQPQLNKAQPQTDELGLSNNGSTLKTTQEDVRITCL